MAGSSLLTLIDDIATLLDDVSVMTKVAAKKTTGVLGDDLALNAEQVSGVDASREIPVVLKVARGSAINKLILVPLALALSVFASFLIKPLLVIGGLFLCFEGFEKVFEKFQEKVLKKSKHDSGVRHEVMSEAEKIKGAIRTDFILSAEIIVITLGTVADQTFTKQIMVLTAIAILMTIGVYGLVAGIVKLDDLGLHMARSARSGVRYTGQKILIFAPYLMKALGVVGTIAMFLVGGGLVSHSIPALHHIEEGLQAPWNSIYGGVLGLVCGGVVAILVHFAAQIFKRKSSSKNSETNQ